MELNYHLLPHILSSIIDYNIINSYLLCKSQSTPLIGVLDWLGIHDSQPLKEKIWAKSFIYLSNLTQPDPDTDKTDIHKFVFLDWSVSNDT